MPKTTTPPEHFDTLADVVKQVGGVPPRRILLWPTPGTATEKDLLR